MSRSIHPFAGKRSCETISVVANVDAAQSSPTSRRRPRSTHLLEVARLSIVEARPSVLGAFMLRFLVGAALAAPTVDREFLVRFFATALVWELAVFFVYVFNGVMDVHEDRVNGSRRPIARGSLPVPVAARIAFVAAAVSLAGAFALGTTIALAVAAFLAIGFLYSGPPAYTKRWLLGTPGTGMSLGLLTYYAGFTTHVGESWLHTGAVLPVFAAGTALWMGLVGTPAKDLSDVVGDAAAGRRTLPVVFGEVATRRMLTAAAMGLAVAFLVVGTATSRLLVWPGVAMVGGAAAIAVTCLGGRSSNGRTNRRPYHVFMTTQYLTHLGVLLAPIGPLE
jgi:4-hydroxybenzoate polyprenyltransferase